MAQQPIDLLPGETLVHEVRGAPPGEITFAVIAVVGLGLIGMSTIVSVVLGVGALYLAYRAFKRAQASKKQGPLQAAITNRRVIAFRPNGSDEIQLSKVETISTDKSGVVLSGSGGSKFRVDTRDPDGLRSSIQRALADHIK